MNTSERPWVNYSSNDISPPSRKSISKLSSIDTRPCHRHSSSSTPLIGHIYRMRQSVMAVFGLDGVADNAGDPSQYPSTSLSKSSTASSKEGLKPKPRSCLVIGHDDLSSSILLVATFGGHDPTRTDELISPHLSREQLVDLLLPIRPTASVKSRRALILQKELPTGLSVLNTRHKSNHHLIWKSAVILIGPNDRSRVDGRHVFAQEYFIRRRRCGEPISICPSQGHKT